MKLSKTLPQWITSWIANYLSIEGKQLEEVENYNYLGVTIKNQLNYDIE